MSLERSQSLDPAVLYRNNESDIFLLDIPTSIAAAQTLDRFPRRRLFSIEAQIRPFPSQDPTSEKSKRKIEDNSVKSLLHSGYASLIKTAVNKIGIHHKGDWCHPRHVAPNAVLGKRKLREDDTNQSAQSTQLQVGQTKLNYADIAAPPDEYMKALAKYEGDPYDFKHKKTPKIVCRAEIFSESDPTDNNIQPALGKLPLTQTGLVFTNEHRTSLQAVISLPHTPTSGGQTYNFFIPPEASVVHTNCNDSSNLRNAIRAILSELSQGTAQSRRFDLILLDPPWPNRSARRKKSYETEYNLKDTRKLLYGMDLDVQLAHGGYVAVWITNKQAVRQFVLGDEISGKGGWFSSLGVKLVEEWIWVKTTVNGECLTTLDAMWRKPYEVLLIGRRADVLGEELDMHGDVIRRVFAAVPDLHSRKPCLKAMFDELLFGGRTYRALEVFARHLVAGWWSWGDEVLKFNWEGYWKS